MSAALTCSTLPLGRFTSSQEFRKLLSPRRSASVCFAQRPPLVSSSSSSRSSDALKFTSLMVRATSSSEETSSGDELLADLKVKWDAIDKSTVLLYGGGTAVAVWLSSIVVGAVNSLPLFPKIMELVGLGYSGWFVYRYLLFKQSRKELASDIDAMKKKITGSD